MAVTPVVAVSRLIAAATSLALSVAAAPMAMLLIVKPPATRAVPPTVVPLVCDRLPSELSCAMVRPASCALVSACTCPVVSVFKLAVDSEATWVVLNAAIWAVLSVPFKTTESANLKTSTPVRVSVPSRLALKSTKVAVVLPLLVA